MRILHVMALEAEYGPQLRARINPLLTGVGPVEAAIALTRALAAAQAGVGLPQYVVSLGSAGSATLLHTQVYQARSVSYRDMDAQALGFAPGVTPFLDQPAELPLQPLVPGLPAARLSTGANVVSGQAYAGIDADMVDMESYALQRVCQAFGLPLIVLRGISDGRDELHQLSDWSDSLQQVDANLATALELVHACLQRSHRP